MKVLIVEDDQSTRDFYEKVVKKVGMKPVSFADAESAWEVCRKKFFPVMILDWILPGMDGLELCQKIRKLPKGLWSIVLVGTVKNKEKDLRAVLDAGADDYIAKPIDLGLLKIRLEIARNNAKRLNEKRKVEEQVESLKNQILTAEKLISIRGMVSGVSHELNNPLQGILGLVQLLENDNPDPNNKKDLREIEKLAMQCKTIVQDLLIFSDSEQTNTEEADLHAIVTRFLDVLEGKLESENISVVRQFDQNRAVVMANISQLNQVIMSVCQNAIDAMPLGGNLTIQTKVINRKPKPVVEIRFQDEGKGIDRDNLRRIFDPFFTTKEVGAGTGLGLSVCHGIIQQHKGSIFVESKGQGKGTSVRIQLPTISG